MLTLLDVVPCSICSSRPILSGGQRSGRLICPNYKSEKIKHGNFNSNRNGITMGFTHWCHLFWSEEQSKIEGIPAVVREWNYIHKNRVTNDNWEQIKLES